MKDLLKKPTSFTRIEFWAATTLFAFIIFFFITDGVDGNSAFANTPYKCYFEEAKVPFRFYTDYFIPQIIRYIFLYLSFSYLTFLVVPKLLKKKAVTQNIFLVIIVFLVAGVVFGITDTYLKSYLYAGHKERDEVDQGIFRESFQYTSWLLWVFVIYTAIKYAGLYLLSNFEAIQLKYKFIRRESVAAFIIWMIGLLLLIAGNADPELATAWAILFPFAILLYSFSFYSLIPKALSKKYPFLFYIGRSFLMLTIAYFPLTLLLSVATESDVIVNLSYLSSVFQMFITVPVTWVLYKRHLKGNEEVFVLTKELKQSAANIDFLRSQINPHFLFNALNTIYGTAIQEKAERTSEGIEKLGDMMRFMLQENLQEKISLNREIDYVNNYISLQRLRTDPNPNVLIQTDIQDGDNMHQIAPMLLIPFVENAFKHGISFRERSHIKVSLEIKNNALYFDVYNSKHPQQESDPEKDKSGIGLENVKQRLKLLYPNKHDLTIRETGKEFFVHLTIQLS
jgi:hypothetical protein